jgi:class 3 adenylate cyclase/TM2 domain-containing membrane protein YozV
MDTGGFKRKLAGILSADVVGYSRLMGENEDATLRTLTACREVMTNLTQQFRGRVVDSPGDNVLAEFGSVVDAVQCAVDIQRVLKARNAELPEDRRMEFRIGINLGDVIEEEDRIYGDGVNIAARLEGLAEPGGICISGSAYEQIENKLPLSYEYLGEHVVKNITKPIRVYRAEIEVASQKRRKSKIASSVVLPKETVSDKKRLLTTILCLCFGIFGAHSFYVGRSKSAVVQLCTLGGLGIWMVIDLILILFGEFSDQEGRKIRDWV